MIFADLLFLYAFLPLNLIFYFISKNKNWRNIVLVSFSLLFYAWGEPLMIFVLIFSALFNYIFALFIENEKNDKKRKTLFVLSVVLTLSFLAVFKYGGFFTESFNRFTGISLPVPRISLPVGISFYSFQIISYSADVYKREIKAQNSFLKFLMYISLYPQLIAGPIVRYSTVMKEIEDRKTDVRGFSEGITRFSTGLAKKVLIANQAGELSRMFLDGDLRSLTVMGAWLGIIAFSLQIYFDFSGYSDMAIGLGHIFGFNFPENFKYPYISKSITEFWRRWHISLGSFFRDYVYIPLGGNRRLKYRNLLVVWFLTGLWHGASWNYVLWGLYYGALIAAEKAFLLKLTEKVPALLKHTAALFAVIFGWAIFYFTDFTRMGGFIKILLGLSGVELYDAFTVTAFSNKAYIVAIAVLFCLPIGKLAVKIIRKAETAQFFAAAANTVAIAVCTVLLVGDTYNPFLYYKF